MVQKRSEELLLKYISKTISQEEEQELLLFLKNEEEREVLERMIENDFVLDNLLKEYDKKRTILRLQHFIQRDKRKRTKKKILWAAAICTVFLGLGSIYVFNNQIQQDEVLVIDEQAITLISSKGNRTEIDATDNETVYDEHGNRIAQIEDDMMKVDADNDVVEYNELNVPYGKKFSVILADGTKAFLNAGSKIKFPTSFNQLASREVVVEGEVYFDVQKDANKPFYVVSKEARIKVVGTKFLYSAYKDDLLTSVVLAEGMVQFASIASLDKYIDLVPGQKASLDRTSQQIAVEQVDTRAYLSWMKGELVFRKQSFGQIIRSLERTYNVEIVNKNKNLETTVFNASFNNNTIEEVLVYFNEVLAIEYTIKDNKIIIK
ncbi:DUF4974 domain-containing protein [Myroides sp. M-43]|uniref:FecR family protein n=1 Tax=Myroides oncorhynchi TaxID=2893756 RepID=UPI001E52B0E5|nr:FecR family protein [Myroides oncorhynchi]MCC9041964.1 DUF4974 domain-containing protein [Myroides oncorhynchi]